jgi:L-histidine N-alpha-methyltransferase
MRAPIGERRPALVAPAAEPALHELAADVRRDLQRAPKQLQPKYLYDAIGSHLFEAICHLPWYRIGRAERRLLERFAEQMVGPLADLTTIVELGCGSGTKLALLAESLRRRGRPVLVRLVDISATALELSARTLGRLPHVSVIGHRASYDAGLREAAGRRSAHGSTLVLFLGSNIGNLTPAVAGAFLREIRDILRPGDALLLGADLVKPERELLLAYDDPIGVTAAFNKNLLARINRELGGDFDLAAFAHRARWDPAAARVEMHLVSLHPQVVRIPGARCAVRFAEGETIWTESSYKYTPEQVGLMGRAAGFRCHRQWIEPRARFALSLFLAADSDEGGEDGVGHR